MSAGIVFARAGVGKNYYDPIPQFRAHGDSRVALALAAGIPYVDTPVGSVSESGVKAAIAGAGLSYNLFIHTGHGSAIGLWGDYASNYQGIILTTDADSLDLIDGDVGVYSFSCLTASDILASIVAGLSGRQCTVSLGYNTNYGFIISNGSLSDIYFISTMAGGFQVIESLIANATFTAAYNAAIAKFNEEIAYWETGDGSSDPFASVIIGVIEADRDALTLTGDGTFTVGSGASPEEGTVSVTTDNVSATFGIYDDGDNLVYSGSGTSWSQAGIAAGSYTIKFGSVSGYITPTDQSFIVIGGSTVSLSGIYVSVISVGTITVTTNNPLSTFTLIGAGSYSGSGTSYSNTNVVPGKYTCTFSNITGFITPSPQTATVGVGGIITFNGVYTVEPASPDIIPKEDEVHDGVHYQSVQIIRVNTVNRIVEEV